MLGFRVFGISVALGEFLGSPDPPMGLKGLRGWGVGQWYSVEVYEHVGIRVADFRFCRGLRLRVWGSLLTWSCISCICIM